MSIKNKFLLSSVVMLVLPIAIMVLISAFVLLLGLSFVPNISIQINDMPLTFYNPTVQKFALAWLFVLIVVVAGCCVGVTTYLSHSILTPLKEISEAMSHIAEGDLDYEFTCSGDAEIKELYNSIEMLRLRLKKSIRDDMERESENRLLVANISHDLKTPITSIKGYVAGIRDGIANTPEKLKKYLDIITLKTESLESMVLNLSMYSKLDYKNIPYDYIKTDLKDFIVSAVDEYELDLKNNNFTICYDDSFTKTESIFTNIDRDKMKRVIANIIGNSIKYSDKSRNGVIKIAADKMDDGMLVSFSDNGIGISEEDAKRAFEKFYRADPARNTNASGNGLGLSIADRIIRAHGGKIWMRPNENKIGVTILMFLRQDK